MATEQLLFLIMVFAAVILMYYAFVIPAFGTEAKMAKQLRARIEEVVDTLEPASARLLREKHLRELSPFARKLEELYGMKRLSSLIEQAGRTTPAYKVILVSMILASITGFIVLLFTQMPSFALLGASIVACLPILKIRQERARRITKFDEQLPDALSVMSRGLRAGLPFADAMKFVAEESSDPIAGEFNQTFSDMNYGVNPKTAFLNMLHRVPSMSLMSMVTAVLIQRETGGNMAEILEKIAAVVRGRFSLQRKVRTLSAEGRMSAWILVLMPFILALMLFIVQPDYLTKLTGEPLGRKLILAACINMTIGIIWIRQIIRIQV